MSLFPSDSVQVVQKTADRLSIVIPPFYSFAAALFVVAILLLVFVYTFRHESFLVRSLLCGLCLVAWLGAFYLATSKRWVILSRRDNMLLLRHKALGLEISSASFPLDSVRAFGLEKSKSSKGNAYSYDIVVEFASGQTRTVTGATTNQSGYDDAVDALNEFIQRRDLSR